MHLSRRSLTLTVRGTSRTADVSNCRIVSGAIPEDSRRLCGPTREYRLQGTAAQDPATDSLWDLVWSHTDERIDVVLRPAGGEVPSDEEPWFTGTVVISESDGDLLGGEANASPGARFVFGFDWAFLAKPTRVTDPSALW